MTRRTTTASLAGSTWPLPPIEVDGRPVPVTLRVSPRAKRLRIVVRVEGVEAVLPVDARTHEAERFLADSTRWIAARVRRIRAAQAAHPGAAALGDGAGVLLRGTPVRLQLTASRARLATVEHRADRLRVTLPYGTAADQREAVVERCLMRWLKAEALCDAEATVSRLGPPNRLVPKVVRVKEQATRWGSCSSKGAINLNWRLVMAPPFVFEYVVVHELCHLEHPHHQPPFWRRVAAILPEYGRARRWLKDNGQRLTLRSPSPA